MFSTINKFLGLESKTVTAGTLVKVDEKYTVKSMFQTLLSDCASLEERLLFSFFTSEESLVIDPLALDLKANKEKLENLVASGLDFSDEKVLNQMKKLLFSLKNIKKELEVIKKGFVQIPNWKTLRMAI